MGKNTLNTIKFINRSIKKHDNKYDYSLTTYIKYTNKVTIICPKHGEFLQTPKKHLLGGCNKCGYEVGSAKQTHNNKYFIKSAINKYGDLYLYDNVDYKPTHKNVLITCKIHGDFSKSPANHLSGQGCPTCSRGTQGEKYGSLINPSLPTILYYFKHKPTNTYKLGITSIGYEKRYKKKMRQQQTLLWFSAVMSREDATELEEFIHDEFKSSRVFNYKYKNNGGTEFFNCDILNKDERAYNANNEK